MSDPPVPAADLLRKALGARAASRLKKAGVSLRDLGAASVSELIGSYGFTEPAAAKTAALMELARAIHTEPLVRGGAFRGSADIYRHFSGQMMGLMVERFHCVLLDGKHRFMREILISQGTLTSSPVHPREVFSQAIRSSAAAVVLCHNHPSGDPSPSADDLEITRRLVQVGDLCGIRVLDHVICGDNSFASLADRGLMS